MTMNEKKIRKLLKEVEKLEEEYFKKYHKRHTETSERIRELLSWFFLEYGNGEKITRNSCFKRLTIRDRKRLKSAIRQKTGSCKTRRDLLHYLIWELLLTDVDYEHSIQKDLQAATVSTIGKSFLQPDVDKRAEDNRSLITEGKERVMKTIADDIDRGIIREDDALLILDTVAEDYVKKADYTNRQQIYTENTFGISETLKVIGAADKYYFLTARDGRVCDNCRALDGLVFTYDEAIRGVNFPPIHPWCRCVAVPMPEETDDKNSNNRRKNRNSRARKRRGNNSK